MEVFDQEIQDGIAEQVKNSKITYASTLFPRGKLNLTNLKDLAEPLNSSKAKVDDIDLYPLDCILVSVGQNGNDDIFLKQEAWNARSTPIHKPSNIEHDPFVIVGHMTATRCLDDATGNVVAEDTKVEELPDVFHIVASSVIYKRLSDEKLISRASDLIEKIESGEMFVSMECLFPRFDYGVTSPTGEQFIVHRDKASAFLTKHLRAYGGTGEYNGYKLGRIPRDIIFSGKGYTENPANPDSVIFTKAEKTISFAKATVNNEVFKNDGVIISQTNNDGDFDMSDQEMVKELQKKLDEALAALAKADIVKYESEIKTLNDKLTVAEKQDKDSKANIDTLANEVAAANKKVEDANKQVADITKARDALKTEIETIKAEQATANRINALVKGGVKEDEAKATVEKFAFLNDEQFEAVASMAITAAKAVETPKTPNPDEAAKAKAAAAELEKAKAEKNKEAALSGQVDGKAELEASRAALAQKIGARLGYKQESDKE